MAFNVKIENFGKLADHEIRIDRFTVFAGPNNSGKSFVSKLLYSIFEAMRANHAKKYLLASIERVEFDLAWPIWESEFLDENSRGPELELEFEKLKSLVTQRPLGNLGELDATVSDIVVQIDRILEVATRIKESRGKTEFGIQKITEFTESLIDLKEELTQLDPETIIDRGRASELNRNFVRNFQVSRVSQLRSQKKQSFVIDIENVGMFEFTENKFKLNLRNGWSAQLRQYSSVIYLESPIYLKLMSALEYGKSNSQHLFGRSRISGVPGYFYDLVDALKFEFTGDVAFPELLNKLTSKEIMGGRIAISENGDMTFQENGSRFSLPVTATGIANLGMLALLIERKVLDENSFLFIDEPEAHLHPAWQVIMAESLFELSRLGVHVVIATHSVDILKWLEVQVKEFPDQANHIALNQFPVTDSVTGDDFDIRLADIKQKLTKPFADLYLKGI